MARRTSVIQVMITGDASDLNKATQSGSQGMSLLGAAAITAAKLIASSASAIAAFSIREFTKFDSKMVQSQAIMGDLSETMRKDMSDAARQVAKTTTFSASEAAEAFYFLASAGMDAEQSIAALPAMASFAQAGMFNLARATDILTDAVTALGLGSDDATENLESLTRISDVLVRQAQVSNASVEQFGDAVLRAAPLARDTGVEIEELAAALGVLADRNVKGAVAGEQFAILLRDLPRAAAKNSKAFKDFGISVENADGSLRPLADIVEDFDKALDGMSVTQRAAAFDTLGLTRSSATVMRQFLGTADALREYQSAADNAFGATIDVQERQLASFANQIALTRSMFADIGITIGEALAGPLLLFNDWIRTQGPAIEAFVDRAIPSIEAFVNRSVAKFHEFRQLFNENLREPLEQFRTTLLGFAEIGREEFAKFFERVRNFATEFKAALEENDSEEAGRVLGELIAETFRQAFARAEIIGDAIKEWADGEDWEAIGVAVGGFAVDFVKGFMRGLFAQPEVAEAELEAGSRTIMTMLRDNFVSTVIGAAILSKLPIVGGLFRVLFAPFKLAFGLLGASIAARVTPLFGSTLLGAIFTALAGIGRLFGGLFALYVAAPIGNGIRTAFALLGGTTTAQAMMAAERIRTFFRGTFVARIGTAISSAFTALRAIGVRAIVRFVALKLAAFVGAIFGWPALLVAAVVGAITLFIIRFRRWFDTQDGEFENIGSAIVEFIWQGVRKLGTWFNDTVIGFFRERFRRLTNWFADQQGDHESLGSAIIDNMITGINRRASALREALVDAARRAWNRVKDFLGISSPSTLFVQVGEDMMEGLAKGVTESARLIQDAVGVNSAAAANEARRFAEMAAAQRATPVSGGGTSITVNVSGAIDPEGTARQIERILRDSQRRTGGVFV